MDKKFEDSLMIRDGVDWQDLHQVQQEITRWASEQFPHRTDHHAIYKLMVHEIPEMMQHKQLNGLMGIGPELADCFILLLDIASMWNVDIAVAIMDKMQVNYNRTWRPDENGIMQHVEPAQSADTETCPYCGGTQVRPISGDDPIHPDVFAEKFGRVTTHNMFCKSCKKGYESHRRVT